MLLYIFFKRDFKYCKYTFFFFKKQIFLLLYIYLLYYIYLYILYNTNILTIQILRFFSRNICFFEEDFVYLQRRF